MTSGEDCCSLKKSGTEEEAGNDEDVANYESCGYQTSIIFFKKNYCRPLPYILSSLFILAGRQ